MAIEQAKQQVLDAAKHAFSAGLFAGTSGNLSVYDRKEGLVAITPSSVRYETMALEDIVVVNIEGNVVEGKHAPSSERLLHLIIYKSSDDVCSVVHTHSPYATAFAVNNKPIPLVLLEMIPFLGGEVPVAPIAQLGMPDVGEGAVKAMEGKNACLLGNHGVVTVGQTIDQAYIRAEYVEDAAKVAVLARQNGELVLVPEEMERKIRGN